jgi:formate dehydrogenase iron-sulfur subunit
MINAQAKGLLLDTTRCIGCGACARASKERNKLPKTSGDFLADTLSDKTFSVVEQRGKRFVRKMCMHCVEPSCASACPVAAFKKTPQGPVVYDEDRCMGCRYCMLACPFNVPRYEWSKALPRVRKCDLCADRLEKGLKTACSTACPSGATTYGTREELIAEANRRIAAEPSRYAPGILGDDELGGTSVLVISDVPPEQLGYHAGLTTEAPAVLTWRVLNKIPNVVALAAVSLGGIWWIRNRRDDVQAAEHPSGHGDASRDHGRDHDAH